MSDKKLCLAMIVKDEANVIEKCLNSVKEIIDYWVIVDTGSSDGTQELIKSLMLEYGIPGELHEKEWVNFEVNRNQSLQLAKGKGDYILVMDADDYLEVLDSAVFENLNKSAYKVEINLKDLSYFRIQLFDASLDWLYEGIIHEYLKIPQIENYSEDILAGVKIIASSSAEIGENKYLNDARIIEKELKRKGLSKDLRRRYTFYLAQSYMDGNEYIKAIKYFDKRSLLGGWHEEIYVSMWMSAKLKYLSKYPTSKVLESFLRAWEYRPRRKEASYDLINFLLENGKNRLALMISKDSLSQENCGDSLWVDSSIYQWKSLVQYAEVCYQNGYVVEAAMALEKLMDSPIFPALAENQQRNIFSTLELYQLTMMCSFQDPSIPKN